MQNLVNFAFFFGVKKERLECFFLRPAGSKRPEVERFGDAGRCPAGGSPPQPLISYFLRREERSKEASTYPKSFPIWKDLTEKSRSFFQGFGMTHRAFAPAG